MSSKDAVQPVSTVQQTPVQDSFTYRQLEINQVRWYWTKQPFNLKGE